LTAVAPIVRFNAFDILVTPQLCPCRQRLGRGRAKSLNQNVREVRTCTFLSPQFQRPVFPAD
jgi:hypothetical protein